MPLTQLLTLKYLRAADLETLRHSNNLSDNEYKSWIEAAISSEVEA